MDKKDFIILVLGLLLFLIPILYNNASQQIHRDVDGRRIEYKDKIVVIDGYYKGYHGITTDTVGDKIYCTIGSKERLINPHHVRLKEYE